MAKSSEQDVEHDHPLPRIAAAFLVTFDNRKGYTISWQKSVGIELDGVVEFKSLPSGLHNVQDDLVYFVHENYAGISAFLQHQDSEHDRNARMIAVGVLVPLDARRLGKSFLYARQLKDLARQLIDQPDDVQPLESLWDENKLQDQDDESAEETQNGLGYQKTRALSLSALAAPGSAPILPKYHPALALPDMIRTFGPLMFPLFRAALTHARILILGEAPVEQTCDFVYNLSILSALPKGMSNVVPQSAGRRTQPLFSIGVADIPLLERINEPWIACTTDDVLASKPQLFDMLVLLPGSSSQRFGGRTYPKIIRSSPELARTFPSNGLRASQRDSRRSMALWDAVNRLQSSADLSHDNSLDGDAVSTTSSISTVIDERETVEPLPWSVVAYTSLIWWASAGDSRSGLLENEELASEQDQALLQECLANGSTKEVAIVAYFQKLAALTFTVLSNATKRRSRKDSQHYRDNANEDDQALLPAQSEGEDDHIEITEEDVRTMGLDLWSESDKQFIHTMVEVYWKRKASVQSGTIECCGIRIL